MRSGCPTASSRTRHAGGRQGEHRRPPIAVGAGPCASLGRRVRQRVGAALRRSHPRAGRPEDARRSRRRPVPVASGDGRIASGVGSVWAITDRRACCRGSIPTQRRGRRGLRRRRRDGRGQRAKDALWVTSEDAGRLTRVNPHTNEIGRDDRRSGRRPGRLAVGEGGVWTLNRGDGTVTRVDPATNKVVATIPVGDGRAAATSPPAPARSGSARPACRSSASTRAPTAPCSASPARAAARCSSRTARCGSPPAPETTWRIDPRLVEAVRP